MNKEEIRGWKDVFSFTLIQTLKSKSYIVSMAILMIIAFISTPVMSKLTGGVTGGESVKTSISTLYIVNYTAYDIKAEDLVLPAGFESITLKTIKGLSTETVPEDHGVNDVVCNIIDAGSSLVLDFVEFPKTDVSSLEIMTLTSCITEAVKEAKINALGITRAQLDELSVSVTSSAKVIDVKELEVTEDTSISQNEYWFLYGVLFVVLMIIIMASSAVATSVVVEKSSKVIEYLLTSIRPLAIIIGKVLATLITVMLQLVLTILSVKVSSMIFAPITGSNLSGLLSNYMSADAINGLNPLNIIIGLIIAGVGLVFYSTLAGLCGATASRQEEASESLMLFTMVALVGAYMGIGSAASLMGGENGFVTFSLIFPISSCFLLPGAIIIGKATPLISLIAIIVLLLSTLLLFKFVAKVYEALILHNGSRLKVKDVLSIYKSSKKKKGEKQHE
ncbi:MAG: ABC transporter permease [Lachnospiraceae bacterium]|nr:ABC transporter permease [Lachnospiraceae bacterium]